MVKRNKIIEKRTEHHYHPPAWMWIKLILWFFAIFTIFVFVTNAFSWISHTINKEEEVYSDCLHACSKKHFAGLKVGLDEIQRNAFVYEYDRTYCIKSCNDLYLRITTKK